MTDLDFTYDSYRLLVQKLAGGGYRKISYSDQPSDSERVVILRHDVDNSLSKARVFAELEKEIGVRSTYFILLTSDFYNIFSKHSEKDIQAILDCGHEVGLHFDEMRYPEIAGDLDRCAEKIIFEAQLLEKAIGKKITVFSYHRPSKKILDADLKVPGLINSYGRKFFRDYKYLSDSRRRWREPVLEIIQSGAFPHLHILTHAFWYHEKERSIQESVQSFVNHANVERYRAMSGNITDIESIMRREEVK